MKRRNALKILPLSLIGATYQVQNVLSQNPRYDHPILSKPERQSDKPLAVQHLRKVREMLLWIRETQSENLLEASYAIAQTVKNKRTCWIQWDMGHSTNSDLVPGREGLPVLFELNYNSNKVKNGDLYMMNRGSVPEADRDKLLIIGAPAPWSSDARGAELITRDSAKHRIRPYSDIWIETNITTIGAVTRVTGSPAPLGPASGVFGMVTFWMIVADTCRILARDSISVDVLGTEPELTNQNMPQLNLHDPLMDDYFEKFLIQMDMIESEMGNIRQIAEMAVDSVLSGGRVYVYSRDQRALAVEAQGRRGGLVLTKGVYERNGELVSYYKARRTPKDLVILGILNPDSPDDLKHLDTFKKEGVKLASIGPMTRGGRIPEGRTVPKEVELSIGSMCDTYGLFAIPGFERKVCPTSGPIQNQLFWAVCMEIAQQLIQRTGNSPGIFFSGAIRGSDVHNSSITARYEQRGY